MNALKAMAKVVSTILVLSLVFAFSACDLFKGSLELESFTVDRSSVKTVYYIGEEIDFSEIRATVKYSDETLNVEYTYNDLTITYDADITATVGMKTVKVSFMDPHLNVEQTAEVSITVKEDPNAVKHDSYVVDTTGMKTDYFVGDTIDLAGIKVIERFTNGGADVEMTDLSTIAYDYDEDITSTAGSKSILVTYNGEDAGAITITVRKPDITVFELDTTGVTLEYNVGDTVSFTGLVANVTYENGDTAEITAFEFVTDLESLTDECGTKQVTVKVNDEISGTTRNESFTVKVDGITEYVLNTDSVKTEYLIGDTVSFVGLLVTEKWYFADDKYISFADLSFDYSDDITSIAGNYSVSVSYNGGVIGTVKIKVEIPNVSSATLDTANVTTEYNVGDTVSLAGLSATIVYENGITRTVNEFTAVTDLAAVTSTVGNKTVLLQFTDPISQNAIQRNLEIKVDGIVSYSIDKTNMTLKYLEGETVSFDGIAVTATYYYGDTENVDFSALTFVHDENISTTPGNKTVTVKIGDTAIGSFIIAIGDIPEAVANTESVDLSYRVGESVSLEGLNITLVFSDGTESQTIPLDQLTVITSLEGITAAAGTKTIEVKYLFDDYELIADFEITVHGFSYLITPPAKLEYIDGDTIDYTGFKVEMVYTDGGESVLVTEGVTKDDNNGVASTAKQTVAVMINGEEIGNIIFTVYKNRIVSATVGGVESGCRINRSIDFTGITVTVKYLNANEVTYRYSDLTLDATNINYAAAGTYEVNITYTDSVNNEQATTEFNVTVYGVDSYTLDVSAMKTTYYVGDSINYTGLVLYANYLDGGSPEPVTEGISFNDTGATNSAGTAQIGVLVNGKSANVSIPVTVIKDSFVSATVGGTYNNVYKIGDTVDFTGITITITYHSGKTEVINDLSKITFSNATTDVAAVKTVTAAFIDKHSESRTVTFEISVTKPNDQVTAFAKPDSITQFESANSNAGKTSYKNESGVVNSGFSSEFAIGEKTYVIGDDNEFVFRPEFAILKDDVDSYLEYFYSNVEIFVLVGTEYVQLTKEASSITDYTYKLNDEVIATVDTYYGTYQFTKPIDKIKISVTPSANYYDNPQNLPAVELEAKVIDAYNVYTANQLAVIDNYTGRTDWDDFKTAEGLANINPAGVVLHNDIEITYKNVPQSFFYHLSNIEIQYFNYETEEIRYYKETAGMNYLIDGTVIYKRSGSAEFTIQGNFFTVDTDKFPLVASPSIFGADSDKGYGSDFSNASLFMFQTIDTNWVADSDVSDVSNVTIENIAFRGNAGRDSWTVQKVNGEETISTTELVTAGGLILVKSSRHASTTLNNVTSHCFFINYFPDYEADMTVNDSKCFDAYQNGAFVWADSTLTLNNTYINGTGGPVIIEQSVKEEINDTDTYFNPILTVNGGCIETHLVGDEVWFKAVGANTLVSGIQALGTGVDTMINTATGGEYHGSWIDGNGKMNIKAVLMPKGNAEAITDGLIQGEAKFDGYGIERWHTNTAWYTILNHTAFAAGAPFITVHDANGTAHTIYFVQSGASGVFYDINNNVLGTQASHQEIIAAFVAADEIILHQGGLSVIFEFYH